MMTLSGANPVNDDKETREPEEPVSALKQLREKAIELFWLAFTVIMMITILAGAVLTGCHYLMVEFRQLFQ